MNGEELADLCARYTELAPADWELIAGYAQRLPAIADLCGADVFIDCLQRGGERAVVVAAAKPQHAPSLYRESTVGKEVLPQNEPGVFSTFRDALPCSDLRAVSQENVTVQQNIVPLINDRQQVVAVLIREKNIADNLVRSRKYESMLRTNLRLQETLDSMEEGGGPVADPFYHIVQLREMNHRVKNNLQMLASVLNMEARHSPDAASRDILSKNVSRILTIASFHDTLSKIGVEGELLLRPLLKRVADCVLSCTAPEVCRIDVVFVGDELTVDSDLAVALMLVLNELLTNCVQHAFPDRPQGNIIVTLTASPVGRSLTVADDGCGFPAQMGEQPSLGLSIVEATVREKIKGRLTFGLNKTVGRGALVQIDF